MEVQTRGIVAWITEEWAAAATGRHRTTVQRWRRAGCWPPELVRLAALELDGQLELIAPSWRGWRLTTAGVLYSPEGWRFSAGEIRTLPLLHQRVAALEHELGRARRRRGALARVIGFGKP